MYKRAQLRLGSDVDRNGYLITNPTQKNGGKRAYDEEGNEYEDYEEDDERTQSRDLYIAEYASIFDRGLGTRLRQLLMENSDNGYIARTRMAQELLGTRTTNSVQNEAGWINEYWFGKLILPQVYGITDWEPSWEKYFDIDEYQDQWDFRYPQISFEIKTNALGYYPRREYICPESKLTTNKPYTTNFAIWWAECQTHYEVIQNRHSPTTSWKYYESSISDWDKLIKYNGWYGLRAYNPKYKIPRGWAETWNDTIRYVCQVKPPTAGEFNDDGTSSDQLFFNKDLLKSFSL